MKVDVHRKNSSESSDNNSGSASSFASGMVKSNSSNRKQQKIINHTRNSISENNFKVNSIVPEPILLSAVTSNKAREHSTDCAVATTSTQLHFNAGDNRSIELASSGIVTINLNNTASNRRQQYKRRSTSNSQLQNKLQRQVRTKYLTFCNDFSNTSFIILGVTGFRTNGSGRVQQRKSQQLLTNASTL